MRSLEVEISSFPNSNTEAIPFHNQDYDSSREEKSLLLVLEEILQECKRLPLDRAPLGILASRVMEIGKSTRTTIVSFGGRDFFNRELLAQRFSGSKNLHEWAEPEMTDFSGKIMVQGIMMGA